MTARISVYCVIKPYDEKKLKSKYPNRIKTILSKLDNKGYKFTPSEFIHDYKKSTIPTCSIRSFRAVLQTVLKIAVNEGVLTKESGENQVPQWFKILESISYWQKQLRSSKYHNLKKETMTTQKIYLNHLWNFNIWLSKNSFSIRKTIAVKNNLFKSTNEKTTFSNVEEILKILENPFSNQSDVIKIIKKYLFDPIHDGKKPSGMSVVFSSIVSYFDKNDQPLKIKFNPNTKYDEQIQEDEIELSLKEFMKMLTNGKPSITEKAVYLCKFQRGLDASTFADRFNFQALEQINNYFGTEKHNLWNLDLCPVPIKLIRMKTGYMHLGFLDRDAIGAIQDYLDWITSKNISLDGVLFVNKFGHPISNSWITSHFFELTNRCGIEKIGSHELRDLLKSTLIDSGCRLDVADHVIGHKPKDSYEKQAKLYPETLRKEYAKASKRLNLFTKFTSVVNGTDDSDELQIQLKDKLDELEKIKQRSLDDEAEKIRTDKMAEQNARQMSQMMDMINELKTQMNSAKNNKSGELEFCCIGCSTVHNSQECPACGSKMKRIYEENI